MDKVHPGAKDGDGGRRRVGPRSPRDHREQAKDQGRQEREEGPLRVRLALHGGAVLPRGPRSRPRNRERKHRRQREPEKGARDQGEGERGPDDDRNDLGRGLRHRVDPPPARGRREQKRAEPGPQEEGVKSRLERRFVRRRNKKLHNGSLARSSVIVDERRRQPDRRHDED